jgi:hypothetical protein
MRQQRISSSRHNGAERTRAATPGGCWAGLSAGISIGEVNELPRRDDVAFYRFRTTTLWQSSRRRNPSKLSEAMCCPQDDVDAPASPSWPMALPGTSWRPCGGNPAISEEGRTARTAGIMVITASWPICTGHS